MLVRPCEPTFITSAVKFGKVKQRIRLAGHLEVSWTFGKIQNNLLFDQLKLTLQTFLSFDKVAFLATQVFERKICHI